MSGRLVAPGIALLVALVALVAALAAAAQLAGCYDIPTPACGFVCGPDGACPDGYTCAADGYCHRVGSPATLTCSPPDAAPAVDAAALDGP